MALDGIFMYNLTNELKESLIGAKIDKINQPEKDEIILTIRGKENRKLLISSSATYPRLHFTKIAKPNPLKAATFCMLMRKYLCGGRILEINQLDLDRVVTFKVETNDELGYESVYNLIIEIMGRHSNISLVRERDGKVMESIKHLNASQNSYRVLYPGVDYIYPPASTKLNIFDFTFEQLINFFKENPLDFNDRFFSGLLTGFGRGYSKELYERYLRTVDSELVLNLLFDFLNKEKEYLLKDNKYIIFSKDGIIKDFYCKDLETYSDHEKEEVNSLSELLEDFYSKKDKQDRLISKSVNIQRLVHTNVERCLKKIRILENTLKDCDKKDELKIKGELLTSYIYSFKKGDKDVTVLNYYNADEEEYMTIPLDINKTPSDNVQKLFKRYSKLKTAEIEALRQLELAQNELNYLYSVSTNLSNVDNYSEIDEIKNELIHSGYIRFRSNPKGKKKKEKTSKPIHFKSSTGLDIYVGKNNIQNDLLTLKSSDKRYTWLHTKEIPGSHVVIASFEVDDETLLEAATLAAFYSKGSGGTKVPVDYTLIKNIKKPSGAKPGMVIYSTNKTIYIDPPKVIETERVSD
ncbi:NFACT RNA binding domain-containing protein [uncultured Clostridium sp.]|jgi:predicted ribosome quality control (RQC) complex YloA/Tae2 family protein|uniref:Rqc2 family fibronectin-binding protein n=1 Tax=uncultured Clostridium sp. TaxID=59620 RepID=UPI0026206B2D|nr:NFACT RNA binding domain-containing protein [uncultured Clostridium sp.]